MFINNFKIAWRNLVRQKMYSSIKIGGFALGIAACLLIALFNRDELSYDRHYPHGDRIYRVLMRYRHEGNIMEAAAFPAPFANTIKEEFPEIEKVGRINSLEYFGAGNNEIRRTDKMENTYESGFIYASQGILDLFGTPMVYGDRAYALDEPNTIVISKRKADKYFPDENPVGKTFILNNNTSKTYKIGGVMENPPTNSHFQYDFLLTLKGGLYPGEETNWESYTSNTYVLLRPGTDVTLLETKFSNITKKYIVPNAEQSGRTDATELGKRISYRLQPVRDIHLRSEGIRDGATHGDIRFIWLFSAIAGFILIIASINFINLSTAKSANRAMEVGLRKTLGSTHRNLISQFLAESILLSFLSFALGTVFACLFLPYFNLLALKSLVMPWNEWWLLPLLAGAATITGILAGLYPAFYLSTFKPVRILKGNVNQGCKSSKMRSSLVIFQFAISIILITSTLIIYHQVGFILNKKIGFDKDQVLLIQGTNSLGDQVRTLKDELLKLPEIKNVSISDYLPVAHTKRNGCGFWNEGKKTVDNPFFGQLWYVDHDYIKTMGMSIVKGRDFSIEMPTDAEGAIINKTMARHLGLENPIGKRIMTSFNAWTVIGVVEDFHFESLREYIGGICLVIGNSPNIVSAKVQTKNMSHTLHAITEVWKTFAPNQAIRYSFLDEQYAMMYADVQRMGQIFSNFAGLAIIVACLGLFALSCFMTQQRTKEIGIRKVLGASISNITLILTRDFLILVFVSNIIAWPLAYIYMNKWLQDFAYRINISWPREIAITEFLKLLVQDPTTGLYFFFNEIFISRGWWMFVISGGIALVIALVTVSFQAIRAATANPVEALKYE